MEAKHWGVSPYQSLSHAKLAYFCKRWI